MSKLVEFVEGEVVLSRTWTGRIGKYGFEEGHGFFLLLRVCDDACFLCMTCHRMRTAENNPPREVTRGGLTLEMRNQTIAMVFRQVPHVPT